LTSARSPSTRSDLILRAPLHGLDAIDAQLTRDQMRRALTLKDLASAHEQGKPILVQSVEGAQFIEGHLERVGEVYTRGLRHLQRLHAKDDLVTPLGDISNKAAHLGD
jgi:membrane dipeptidase